MTVKRNQILGVNLSVILISALVLGVIGIASGEKTTVTIWALSNFLGMDPLIEKQATAFEASHSNIDVKAEFFPWQAYWDKLLTSIAAGTGPDVIYQMHPTFLGPYIKGEVLLPLPKAQFNVDKEWHSSAAKPWEFKGNYYGLQYLFNPHIFFYNKDLFKTAGLDPNRPPETWDELANYAQRLTMRDATGKIIQSGFAATLVQEDWLWANLIYVQGGNLLTPEGEVAFDTPEALKALQFMRDLVFKYKVNNRQFLGMEGFQTGKIAMMILYATFVAQMTDYPNIDYGTAHIPTPRRGMKDRSVMYGDWGTCITKAARDRGSVVEWATYDFVKLASSKEQHAEILMIGATSGPVRNDVLGDQVLIKKFLEKYPKYKPVVEKIPYTEYVGALPNWERVQKEALTPMFDRIFLLQWDAKKALDECVKTAKQILAEAKEVW